MTTPSTTQARALALKGICHVSSEALDNEGTGIYSPTLSAEPSTWTQTANDTGYDSLSYERSVVIKVGRLLERRDPFPGGLPSTVALLVTSIWEEVVASSTHDLRRQQDAVSGRALEASDELRFGMYSHTDQDVSSIHSFQPTTFTLPPDTTTNGSQDCSSFIKESFSDQVNWLHEQLRTEVEQDRSIEVLNRIEADSRLQTFEAEGPASVAQRIKFLRTVDEEDGEEDLPLTDEAALGFMDFMDLLDNEGAILNLSLALGRLCAQWTYPDNRALVVWFKNRVDLAVTAFNSERNILGHIGQDPAANNLESAAKLLVRENFFSWRQDLSA